MSRVSTYQIKAQNIRVNHVNDNRAEVSPAIVCKKLGLKRAIQCCCTWSTSLPFN